MSLQCDKHRVFFSISVSLLKSSLKSIYVMLSKEIISGMKKHHKDDYDYNENEKRSTDNITWGSI